jgi:D-arabinitol 2-dehydrogenase
VHCLDISAQPDEGFSVAQERVKPEYGGSLEYHQADVREAEEFEMVISGIADENQRLDGLIAGKTLRRGA